MFNRLIIHNNNLSGKKADDPVKNGVKSAVISSTELASLDSDRFHCLPIPFMGPSFIIH